MLLVVIVVATIVEAAFIKSRTRTRAGTRTGSVLLGLERLLQERELDDGLRLGLPDDAHPLHLGLRDGGEVEERDHDEELEDDE